MEASEGLEKCMHEACRCTVGPGQQYCSPYCEAEAQRGTSVQPCQCGHEYCEEART